MLLSAGMQPIPAAIVRNNATVQCKSFGHLGNLALRACLYRMHVHHGPQNAQGVRRSGDFEL